MNTEKTWKDVIIQIVIAVSAVLAAYFSAQNSNKIADNHIETQQAITQTQKDVKQVEQQAVLATSEAKKAATETQKVAVTTQEIKTAVMEP